MSSLPADLSRFLETVWQIKRERADAARERDVQEEMARYREDEQRRRWGMGSVRFGAITTDIVTEYGEIQ